MDLTNLNIQEKDIKYSQNKLFLCNEKGTKLIYENLDTQKVIGLVNQLNGKIIEVIGKRNYKNRIYYKVKNDGIVLGWVLLDNSIRLYRIPKKLGKFTRLYNIPNSYFKYSNLENQFINKMVEARYYFVYKDTQGIIVNIMGNRQKFLPVLINDFYQLRSADKNMKIKLESNTTLYTNNYFEEAAEKLDEPITVKVLAYYKNLNEVKIKIKGMNYWVYGEVETDSSKENEIYFENEELLDLIIFLKAENKLLKNKLANEVKIKKTVRDNLSISNDLQSLFIKRYLGDLNETE
ncbi:GW dipeptide domain-containing protein [Salinicoccus sp. Marseille-QA3877]